MGEAYHDHNRRPAQKTGQLCCSDFRDVELQVRAVGWLSE